MSKNRNINNVIMFYVMLRNRNFAITYSFHPHTDSKHKNKKPVM